MIQYYSDFNFQVVSHIILFFGCCALESGIMFGEHIFYDALHDAYEKSEQNDKNT